jgi:UDP-N-acetylglucosamine 4-epimerase
MKCLVTGVGGFIGSHLADKLCELGHEVVGIDNHATQGDRRSQKLKHKHDNFYFESGDCRTWGTANDLDIIFHQAAWNSIPRSMTMPYETYDNNVLGFMNIIKLALKKNARLVFASSASLYGDNIDEVKVEGQEGTVKNPYGHSKKINEEMCMMFQDLEWIGLRYFNVFGPDMNYEGDHAPAIGKFTYNILNDREINLYGDGSQKRDFTFIDNVINANLLCMDTPNSFTNQAYNICSGQTRSLNEVIAKIASHAGKTARIVMHPPRKNDVKVVCGDFTKAKAGLGYIPDVLFDRGIQKTVNFFRGE